MLRKLLLFTGLILALAVTVSGADDLTADRILEKNEDLMRINNGKYLMEITTIRPGKSDRTSRMQVYIKNADKVLVRVLAPPQEQGQGYLKLGEDEWFYLPNANKSIRISGKGNLQGSDLSNDDVLKIKLLDDYTPELAGRETLGEDECYVLNLTAKRPSVTYGKLKSWIRKTDFQPIKTEYYALSGKLLKTMIYSQIKSIGGRIRPTRMEIESELRKGYKTLVNVLEASFDVEFPDSMFTRVYLEKGK